MHEEKGKTEMSSLFEPHIAEMGAHGHSLMGEWQEQIQFLGGSTKVQIENRVYAR
jgi:hypothetical protein